MLMMMFFKTERVIINLMDWHGDAKELIKQFEDWTIDGLIEIIAIDKNKNIFHIYPREEN